MCGKALVDRSSALEDSRRPGKWFIPLPEVMLLVLCATLAAAEDFVEVRRWGREKLVFLRTMLPFEGGIPSHETLNDVMNTLDPALFSDGFTAWVESLREEAPDIVAADGKSSRRARRGRARHHRRHGHPDQDRADRQSLPRGPAISWPSRATGLS